VFSEPLCEKSSTLKQAKESELHEHEPVEEASYRVRHESGGEAMVDLIRFDEPDCGLVGWLAFYRQMNPGVIRPDMLSPTQEAAMTALGESDAWPNRGGRRRR
jgi:hypothetical protein